VELIGSNEGRADGTENFGREGGAGVTNQTRWLNMEQLLAVLPLKKSRVYYLVHTNRIPHCHIGKTLIFDYDEIASWVSSNGQMTT
jgi:predicted DNA-binding transcriptional regulator AlpA